MTRAEVAELVKAIQMIETGRAEYGVAMLRRMVVENGAQAPPLIVVDHQRPPRGKER